MRNYAGICKGICSYNLVYQCLIQLLPLQSSVFLVQFSNAFWYGNLTFPKSSSQNEIVPPLVIFQYKDVKICLHLCRYQNQYFSLVSHACRSCSTRVALMSFVQHSCLTHVALVPLVSSTRLVKQTRSIDQQYDPRKLKIETF